MDSMDKRSVVCRSFLASLLRKHLQEGKEPRHWQFTKLDEAFLFEFIHPSVNTRESSFRLFNLPVRWDARDSALVDADGSLQLLDMGTCSLVDPELSLSVRAAVAKLPVGLTAQDRQRAIEMLKAGQELRWAYGSLLDEGRI